MIAKLIQNRRLELGYTTMKLSQIVGVSQSTIFSWERGEFMPSQLNLAKLARALELSQEERFNLLRLKENKGAKRPKLTKKFYDLLHELEDEFGKISLVPEDDKRLFEIRRMVGVEGTRTQGYDKQKVDEVRISHNISKLDVSIALGYSRTWFTTTFLQGPQVFTKEEAEMFADFFDVDIEVFEE